MNLRPVSAANSFNFRCQRARLYILIATAMINLNTGLVHFLTDSYKCGRGPFFSFELQLRLNSLWILIYVTQKLLKFRTCFRIRDFFFSVFVLTNNFGRHVILPTDVARKVPEDRLMSEAEWRAIGVQQSRGWEHYMIHRPGMKDDTVSWEFKWVLKSFQLFFFLQSSTFWCVITSQSPAYRWLFTLSSECEAQNLFLVFLFVHEFLLLSLFSFLLNY